MKFLDQLSEALEPLEADDMFGVEGLFDRAEESSRRDPRLESIIPNGLPYMLRV